MQKQEEIALEWQLMVFQVYLKAECHDRYTENVV